MSHTDPVTDLISHFRAYAQARVAFLSLLHRPASNRDPLAEFSEFLVARLLHGTLAPSPTQKGYDLKRDGSTVQVRYLANTGHAWVNEHHVIFTKDVDEYALVVFIGLELQAVLVFKRETIGQVCNLLGKKHPNQHTSLQLTKRNYDRILAEPAKFASVGLEVRTFGKSAAG